MSEKRYNPLAKKGFDLVGTTDDFDSRYVNVTGDTMTGDLEFPVTGFIMDDGASLWRVTIDDTGALVTTVEAVVGVGNPMGLLLALTYSA